MIQEDFEQHVVKLQNALLGFAKSLTHNEDEAKDLLQETSLKALSNKAMYDDSGSIKSWLYTIMRNLFLNCRRHSSRQESLPTAELNCRILGCVGCGRKYGGGTSVLFSDYQD